MDYDHRHHVGNRADVWKHVVLLAALAALKTTTVAYAETHAGRGRYPARPGGEWEGGVGSLRGATGAPGPVDRYLARIRRAGTGLSLGPGLLPAESRATSTDGELRSLIVGESGSRSDRRPGPELPGSPVLAAGSLGRRDRLHLFERDPEAAAALRAAFAADPRARVEVGDGYGLALAPDPGRRAVVLVDPPYSGPDDWAAASEVVTRLHRADPAAVLLLWLPVKRWTRPNALRHRLREGGVPALHLDLLWARPEGRDDLAGSATTAVNLPDSAAQECLAAGAWLGPRLSIDGSWSVRGSG